MLFTGFNGFAMRLSEKIIAEAKSLYQGTWLSKNSAVSRNTCHGVQRQ
jgi:hypothetical protein